MLAVTFELEPQPELAADPLRGARTHARRRAGRERAARRRARGGAGPAPLEGHGDRPGRPGLGVGGLVLHEPDPRPRALRAARGARRGRPRPGRTAAQLPRAGRAGEDLGRVARRARRLRPRLRRAGADHGLDEALARPHEPRRRDDRASSSSSRTRSRSACASGSASSSRRSRRSRATAGRRPSSHWPELRCSSACSRWARSTAVTTFSGLRHAAKREIRVRRARPYRSQPSRPEGSGRARPARCSRSARARAWPPASCAR